MAQLKVQREAYPLALAREFADDLEPADLLPFDPDDLRPADIEFEEYTDELKQADILPLDDGLELKS